MRITSSKFLRLPRHKQTEIYFSHELNLTTGKNRSQGPSMRAQAEFQNDWLAAFYDFADRLDAAATA